MRGFLLPTLTTAKRQQIQATRPGDRPVVSTYRSTDGRLYAYDGLCIRVISHGQTDRRRS